jgi:lipoyl(octanoyl) transferase
MFLVKLSRKIQYLDYISFQERSRKKRRESILFLEHFPTITAGINTRQENLLVSREYLEKKGIQFLEIPRGGDLTAHEPGQIVVYFHIDLQARELGVGEFLDFVLESAVRATKEAAGLDLVPKREAPGLYWDSGDGSRYSGISRKSRESRESSDRYLKILSMGVYFKSFFTSFGIAMNWSNNREVFQNINPCGISAESMTSLSSLGIDRLEERREKWIQLMADFWEEYLKKKTPAQKTRIHRYLG